MDNIRVIRLVEYFGPRDLVEEQVSRSLHGTKTIGNHLGMETTNPRLMLIIRATTLGEFSEIIPKVENLELEALKLENEILQKTIEHLRG